MVRALNTVLSQCLLTSQLLKQRVWIWVLAGSLLYFLGEENLPWECLNSHHSKNTGGTNVHLNEDCCQLETTTNIYFNPSTPMNDQDRISHHNIYTISTR